MASSQIYIDWVLKNIILNFGAFLSSIIKVMNVISMQVLKNMFLLITQKFELQTWKYLWKMMVNLCNVSKFHARTSTTKKTPIKEISFLKYPSRRFLSPTQTKMLWKARSGKVKLIGWTRRKTWSYWFWGWLEILKYRYFNSYILMISQNFKDTNVYNPHPTIHKTINI